MSAATARRALPAPFASLRQPGFEFTVDAPHVGVTLALRNRDGWFEHEVARPGAKRGASRRKTVTQTPCHALSVLWDHLDAAITDAPTDADPTEVEALRALRKRTARAAAVLGGIRFN